MGKMTIRMSFVPRVWRRGLFVAAFLLLAGGSLEPGHAHDAFNFDWLVGDDEQMPPTSQPEHWELADGETITAMLGQTPANRVVKAATCQMNFPYKGTWPGPESGAQWATWTERMKQDQTLFLAGAFTREGAWLDSVSTQCSGIQADGSWTESKPLAATATGLGQNGIPTTMYNALLYGVTANTGEWVKGERDCPTDITRPCIQDPDTWKMGGSPFTATCPKNSYIVGINAVVALEKNAIARIGVHCLNPLTGETAFSGLRQTDNSDGTSNGLTYRLLPSSSWSDGVFCPEGQLANGFIGYNDWGDADNKSYDHLTAVGLICRAYSIIKPPVVAQVGYNRFGSDIAQLAMTASDPNACAAECGKNGACQAWSYVFKNVRGEAQCWLKNPAPVAIEDPCCISGVKLPLGAQAGENRVGSDYYHAEIYSADPNVCADYCKGDATCESWTYVKPGVQGDNAVCWYKNAAPAETADPCCISSVKNPLVGTPTQLDATAAAAAALTPPPSRKTVGDAIASGGVGVLSALGAQPTPPPSVSRLPLSKLGRQLTTTTAPSTGHIPLSKFGKVLTSAPPASGAVPAPQTLSATCTSGGEVCNMPAALNLPDGTWSVQVSAPASHCSPISYRLATDNRGDLIGDSGPLAPGEGSQAMTVPATTRQIYISATGIPGGCNKGTLSSWGVVVRLVPR
jgi:hypothetical protein